VEATGEEGMEPGGQGPALTGGCQGGAPPYVQSHIVSANKQQSMRNSGFTHIHTWGAVEGEGRTEGGKRGHSKGEQREVANTSLIGQLIYGWLS
jgi:hypothetical protein